MPEYAGLFRKIPVNASGMDFNHKCRHFPNPGRENKRGPRTVPCGTPDTTGAQSDLTPFTTVHLITTGHHRTPQDTIGHHSTPQDTLF